MTAASLAPFSTTNSAETSDQSGALMRRLGYWFLAWLVVRTLLWTGVTTLTFDNPPLDTVEMLYWGQEWELGYFKHPPLPPWLAELSFWAAGMFGVYLIGYVLGAVTSWAVWQLARQLLPARDALLAALSLEGVFLLTYHGKTLNHNLVLTTFWTLTALFLYQAYRTDRLRDWLAVGLCAGLGVLSKYTVAFLLGPLLAWLVLVSGPRIWLRRGPYVALLALLLVAGPHLLWSAANDWPALTYARNRVSGDSNWWAAHLYQPVVFSATQLLYLAPMLAVLAWGLHRRLRDSNEIQREGIGFVATVVLAPFVLHLMLGFGLGWNLSDRWAMPFWGCAGLLLLLLLPPRPEACRPMSLALVGCNLGVLLCVGGLAIFGPLVGWREKPIHFPGRALAEEADRYWREGQASPIPAVAGDTWYAGCISLYAPGRPHVVDGDPLPGSDRFARRTDAILNQRGGVLVWNAETSGQRPELLPEFVKRFPTAGAPTIVRLSNDVSICLAIVPPAAPVARR